MKLLTTLLAAAAFTGFTVAADEPAKAKPVKVEQAGQLIAGGVQILDVRTKDEWDQGHLKDAKWIPIADARFVESTRAGLDPKKPVLVYCKSGGRSAKAAKQLREAGYIVHDMDGGITAWQKAGKPVVK